MREWALSKFFKRDNRLKVRGRDKKRNYLGHRIFATLDTFDQSKVSPCMIIRKFNVLQFISLGSLNSSVLDIGLKSLARFNSRALKNDSRPLVPAPDNITRTDDPSTFNLRSTQSKLNHQTYMPLIRLDRACRFFKNMSSRNPTSAPHPAKSCASHCR